MKENCTIEYVFLVVNMFLQVVKTAVEHSRGKHFHEAVHLYLTGYCSVAEGLHSVSEAQPACLLRYGLRPKRLHGIVMGQCNVRVPAASFVYNLDLP